MFCSDWVLSGAIRWVLSGSWLIASVLRLLRKRLVRFRAYSLDTIKPIERVLSKLFEGVKKAVQNCFELECCDSKIKTAVSHKEHEQNKKGRNVLKPSQSAFSPSVQGMVRTELLFRCESDCSCDQSEYSSVFTFFILHYC